MPVGWEQRESFLQGKGITSSSRVTGKDRYIFPFLSLNSKIKSILYVVPSLILSRVSPSQDWSMYHTLQCIYLTVSLLFLLDVGF